LDENFYVRGDGTRVYFFDEDELRGLFAGDKNAGQSSEPGWPKFEVTNLGTDRRMLVNRQRRLKMYRCWMQGRFRKPEATSNDSLAS
jgi:tRNAThr (cytosine32-N3)-methyltransferase